MVIIAMLHYNLIIMYITNFGGGNAMLILLLIKNNEPNEIAGFFSGHTHRYLLKSFDIQQ